MPPNPPSNAHGFAMRSMSLRDMQSSKSEQKKFLAPPLPNPGDAPVHLCDDKCTGCHMTAECMESNSECMRGDMPFRVIYPASVS